MTMGFIKKTVVATALAAAVVAMAGQGGAFAVAGGGAVGTGTITPGLGAGCFQSVTFDSFVLVYADTGSATVSATSNTHFDGASDGCETLNAGEGHGNLSGGLAGAISYKRVASLVTLVGTINGGSIVAGACIFVPTSVLPVTSFALACAAAAN